MTCVEAYRNSYWLNGIINPETGKLEIHKGPKRRHVEDVPVYFRNRETGSVTIVRYSRPVADHFHGLNGNGPAEFEIIAPEPEKPSSNSHR